jgi:hypothetical protein
MKSLAIIDVLTDAYRLCPVLNGTMKPEDGLADASASGFGSMGAVPAL